MFVRIELVVRYQITHARSIHQKGNIQIMSKFLVESFYNIAEWNTWLQAEPLAQLLFEAVECGAKIPYAISLYLE